MRWLKKWHVIVLLITTILTVVSYTRAIHRRHDHYIQRGLR